GKIFRFNNSFCWSYTSDNEAPSKITGLTSLSKTLNSVNLTWKYYYNSDFKEYTVYYDTLPNVTKSSKKWNYVNDANLMTAKNSYSKIMNLTSFTRYYFAVSVKDDAGNESELSDTISVYTNSSLYALDVTATGVSGSIITDFEQINRIKKENIEIKFRLSSASEYSPVIWVDTFAKPDGAGIGNLSDTKINCSLNNGYWSAILNVADLKISDGDVIKFIFECDGGLIYRNLYDEPWQIKMDNSNNFDITSVNASKMSDSTTTVHISWLPRYDMDDFSEYIVVYQIGGAVTSSDSQWTYLKDPNLKNRYTSISAVRGLLPNENYTFSVITKDLSGNLSLVTTSVQTTTNSQRPAEDPATDGYNTAHLLDGTEKLLRKDITVTTEFEYAVKTGDKVYLWYDAGKRPDGKSLENDEDRYVEMYCIDGNARKTWECVIPVSDNEMVNGTLVEYIFEINNTIFTNKDGATFKYIIDAEAPAQVQSLTLYDRSSSAYLFWTPVSSADFNTYKIRYSKDFYNSQIFTLDRNSESILGTLSSSLLLIRNLDASSNYYFEICSVDKTGNESPVKKAKLIRKTAGAVSKIELVSGDTVDISSNNSFKLTAVARDASGIAVSGENIEIRVEDGETLIDNKIVFSGITDDYGSVEVFVFADKSNHGKIKLSTSNNTVKYMGLINGIQSNQNDSGKTNVKNIFVNYITEGTNTVIDFSSDAYLKDSDIIVVFTADTIPSNIENIKLLYKINSDIIDIEDCLEISVNAVSGYGNRFKAVIPKPENSCILNFVIKVESMIFKYSATNNWSVIIDNQSPEKMTYPSLISKNENSVTLSLNPVQSEDFNYYSIYYNTSPVITPAYKKWSVSNDNNLRQKNNCQTMITGLTSNTEYYFAVSATDIVGNESVLSDTIKVLVRQESDTSSVPQNDMLPAAVSEFAVSDYSNYAILNWTPSQEQDFKTYKIRYRTNLSDTGIILTTSEKTELGIRSSSLLNLNNLDAYVTYYIDISVIDIGNNESPVKSVVLSRSAPANNNADTGSQSGNDTVIIFPELIPEPYTFVKIPNDVQINAGLFDTIILSAIVKDSNGNALSGETVKLEISGEAEFINDSKYMNLITDNAGKIIFELRKLDKIAGLSVKLETVRAGIKSEFFINVINDYSLIGNIALTVPEQINAGETLYITLAALNLKRLDYFKYVPEQDRKVKIRFSDASGVIDIEKNISESGRTEFETRYTKNQTVYITSEFAGFQKNASVKINPGIKKNIVINVSEDIAFLGDEIQYTIYYTDEFSNIISCSSNIQIFVEQIEDAPKTNIKLSSQYSNFIKLTKCGLNAIKFVDEFGNVSTKYVRVMLNVKKENIYSYNNTVMQIPADILQDSVFIDILKESENETEFEKVKSSGFGNLQVLNGSLRKFDVKNILTEAVVNQEFEKMITVEIPYSDNDNNGFEDNTGIECSKLKMYRFNESTNKWEVVSDGLNYSDPVSKSVKAELLHFSYYSVAAPKYGSGADTGFYVFPNPYRQRYGTGKVIFNGVSGYVELLIYNLAGRKVYEFYGDAGIELEWNLQNMKSEEIASGVYIYKLIYSGGEKIGKIGIIK
ncbi:T9SS type A sorting domain-containing protein, partial [Candidatus Dependentiae bacterium]|nr:T9SS type A sorting domain-containing protein [Candidatus Dependentiae bacterium]